MHSNDTAKVKRKRLKEMETPLMCSRRVSVDGRVKRGTGAFTIAGI